MAFSDYVKRTVDAKPGPAAVPESVSEGVVDFQVEDTVLGLTGKQVNEISLLFGGSIIRSAEDLMRLMRRTQTVKFADTLNITLSTDDLWALKQQSLGMNVPYEEYVRQFVADAVKWELNGFGSARR